MYNRFSFSILFAIGFFLISSTNVDNSASSQLVLNRMISAIQGCNGMAFQLDSYEKNVNEKNLQHGKTFTKINVAPRKIYMKILSGSDAGAELLYPAEEGTNKMLVNAGKWIPNIRLEPTNTLVTKNQHHTIFAAGFNHMLKVIIKAREMASSTQTRFDSVFQLNGEVTYNNQKCYVLKITDNRWQINNYKTSKSETVNSIAGKLLVSEYQIMELNKLKDITDEIGNTTIKIPSGYAHTTIFYIDKKTLFPIYQSLQDEKGNEFERYEFSNLQLNPSFKSDEFSHKFSDYGF